MTFLQAAPGHLDEHNLLAAAALNVKRFGAVGDGTTNDTEAIAAALAALDPGDTLLFPPGRFMVDGGLTVATPTVRIVGPTGRARSFDTSAQLFLRNGSSANALTITASAVTIRDLSLVGNKANTTAAHGIRVMDDCNYLLLDGVWVDGFPADGIRIGEGSEGTISSTITNSEFRNCGGYGMHLLGGSTDQIITNCYIDQNALSGVHVRSGDVSLTSCHIWGNGTAIGGSDFYDGITARNVESMRVVNCFVETNLGHGIAATISDADRLGNMVSLCDVWANGRHGVYLDDQQQFVLANNIVRDNNREASTYDGIRLTNCDAVTVLGNHVYAGHRYGYSETGTNTGCIVANNIIRAADAVTGSTSASGSSSVFANNVI